MQQRAVLNGPAGTARRVHLCPAPLGIGAPRMGSCRAASQFCDLVLRTPNLTLPWCSRVWSVPWPEAAHRLLGRNGLLACHRAPRRYPEVAAQRAEAVLRVGRPGDDGGAAPAHLLAAEFLQWRPRAAETALGLRAHAASRPRSAYRARTVQSQSGARKHRQGRLDNSLKQHARTSFDAAAAAQAALVAVYATHANAMVVAGDVPGSHRAAAGLPRRHRGLHGRCSEGYGAPPAR